ncbi:hypothetical protein PG996_000077 [Apiospora saccharicola]|uniref:2EXR domain-containing protein n=1 Tax=Apiospora saccharicola TaxID=335842 RepID=A0ABR1WCR7_9PEZI
MASIFPQFCRFPAEIQIMVWEQFIHNEAANRLVLYHQYTGLSRKEFENRKAFDLAYPQSLRVMPSKWLVSPLLSVDSQSRAVALEQYPTRLDIFDVPRVPLTYWAVVPYPTLLPSHAEWEAYFAALKERRAREDAWIRLGEVAEAWQTREIPRWRRTFPKRPAWEDRRAMCDQVDMNVSRLARDIMMFEPADAKACRGCVYLNLATDRFAEAVAWTGEKWEGPGWYGQTFDRPDGLLGPKATYGQRALSDALTDFQYHGAPFDLREVLNRRDRPAPLQYASAGLSDEVLGQVRHLVFADHEQARMPRKPPVSPPCVLFDTRWLNDCCPQALEPEGAAASGPTTSPRRCSGASSTTSRTRAPSTWGSARPRRAGSRSRTSRCCGMETPRSE